MNASRPSSDLVAEPVRTAARPRPFPKWAGYVLLAPIAASYYLLDMNSFPQLVHETQPALLAMGALVFLDVMVELRRVREWSETTGSGKNRSTSTVSKTEYSQQQHVDAASLREGKELRIPLELPEADPASSTVLHGSLRCFWELQLTSKVPGVDLDATFVLPIYYSEGENPEPGR